MSQIEVLHFPFNYEISNSYAGMPSDQSNQRTFIVRPCADRNYAECIVLFRLLFEDGIDK
jgi:hypothetical protein